jgi:Flp pilus assembly protein TadB
MKGEMSMNRFKLLIMTMNRFRLLLLTAFVLAGTVLAGVAFAAQEPAPPNQATGQDAVAKQKAAEQAVKARAMRDAVQKRRQDAQKFLKENATGHQPAAEGAAPANAGTGGGQ